MLQQDDNPLETIQKVQVLSHINNKQQHNMCDFDAAKHFETQNYDS